MRMTVEGVIYLYIFICVALLAFNLLYIWRSKWVEKRRGWRIRRWKTQLRKNTSLSEASLRQLKDINQLTAFSVALEESGLVHSQWFRDNIGAIQTLAGLYVRRPAMERAFMAYWLASFHTRVPQEQAMLPQLLLQYLDRSTVFSRENTLLALYALGYPPAIEHAFQIMSDRQYYHNPKLLSDGLARYTGDPDELIERLWKHRGDWEECLSVAIVQYASLQKEDHWGEAFLPAMMNPQISLEIRFALIRYFQRHRHDGALPELLRLVYSENAGESELKVAAVSALQNYPGEEVHQALLYSLQARNWYVRRNAAQALLKRGISQQDLEQVRRSGDRYALEMLEYMAQ